MGRLGTPTSRESPLALLALYARSAHWCSFALDLIQDIALRESRAMDLVDDRARRVSGLDGRLKCLVHSRTIANSLDQCLSADRRHEDDHRQTCRAR